MSLFAVTDLSISFDVGGRPHQAVRGAGFTLDRGRVLAVVGESGSGKSVTALAALGLLPGTATVSGSIRLDGEELLSASLRRLRQIRGGAIGTVFQEPMSTFNPMYRIGWQLAEAIRVHGSAGRREALSRARELLDTVGIRDTARAAAAYPHELSGGQLQRAAIAMAISNDPALLILDEPTTALDVTVQAGILELLHGLRERTSTAILLITHDMGVVADLADDAVVLRDGEVVEIAEVGDLFAAPRHDYTRALLGAVPRIAPRSHPAPPVDPEPVAAVSVRGVTVDYAGRHQVRAVRQATLSIQDGEIVGLVGESGSGKSTLGRAIVGLVPLAEGQIHLAGTPVAGPRRALRRLRARTGIVFQDPASSLNPQWTVGTSVAEPLYLHTTMSAAARRAKVADLLASVGMDPAFAARHPHQMSGGQRQRAAIARAIALDPALLIADEPTSALDVSVQARILDLLRELQGRLGFACLFISHDLAVVSQLASRVAVMHQGRIVEQGSAEQVLLDPREPYTRRLLAAAPVPDPLRQRRRGRQEVPPRS
ncbi:peptide/nickel transport system ATP-binding protein [Allocatelliglobosispora scoriae]|uniref:Peptide/nickel transport system ATP-binding protein n=1 Tax=Allocatelliglobosispora scoriae TaxID=643052 RepID=A0A841C3R6_9ACTN|nr:ABC transporter ATP-binding protein [Allocatelliglobosispora scoriae]MBB5873702.1 peptide/nickel transport system ATP-binding protein [Allocatelliglobosispora scoriae]